MNFLEMAQAACGPEWIEREITLEGGGTVKVLVRKLGADEGESMFFGVHKDEKKLRGLREKLIAAVIAFPNPDGGDPVRPTLDEAKKLSLVFANQLKDVAFEVNGMGEEKKSDPEDASASGTS